MVYHQRAHARVGVPSVNSTFPLQCAAIDSVAAFVGAPDRAIGRAVNCMRTLEQRVAPGSGKAAVTVEDDDRMAAAVEHVDAIVPINRDAADVGEVPAVRHLRPVRLHTVGEVTASDDRIHGMILRRRFTDQAERRTECSQRQRDPALHSSAARRLSMPPSR